MRGPMLSLLRALSALAATIASMLFEDRRFTALLTLTIQPDYRLLAGLSVVY